MSPQNSSRKLLIQRKSEIRKSGQIARKGQPSKDSVSDQIISRLRELPEYQVARCVLWYVSSQNEVRTQQAVAGAISSNKKVVVPFCEDRELKLFWLESMDELETGRYGILEPKKELRGDVSKKMAVTDVNLIIVPGVAFDSQGHRLGHGHGYYDKCLQDACPETTFVALAFECQMFNEIPMQDHDIAMNKVVTERTVHHATQRS